MAEFVYLSERKKFIWNGNDWIANQTETAWSSAVYRDFKTAKAQTIQDYEYMFDFSLADIVKWFEKPEKVKEFKQEVTVGRVAIEWLWSGVKYKVVYRITKKLII